MADAISRLKTALADRYAIERELGRGGMAVVYLANDVKHGRHVAVKVLLPELAATLGGDRFLQEIRVTAKLTHPHILALYDSGEADGLLYYVMPYVEGESLRDRLKREKQLPVEDALRITEQVASALDFAHRHDVIHRDIKPENILLHEGVAMVADFGIALAVKAAGGERLTETGLSIGTPEYMSPEQVAGERTIDARSDLYSLACVLYEMLAGQPPFTGATGQAVLARHVTDAVPPITTVRSSVPPGAVSAIDRALAKAPADRFDTAKDFAEALWAEAAVSEAEVKSIVVLPFDNLSPDSDQEYFSDGLTEEVISDLSKVRSLRVISRSSAMTFKGSNRKIPEIARELNVRYALEGSVRKAGKSLRITAQLIDAKDDAHVWADKYAGTLDDVFTLQEAVSRSVVDALRLELGVEEERRMGQRPTESTQAYDCYLRARYAIESYTQEGFERACRHLENGLTLIPDSALLHSGLGYVYWNYANQGLGETKYADLAEECASKALALDPQSAEAHFVLGVIHQAFRGDQKKAFHHLKRSLAIRPDDAHAAVYAFFGHYLVGRTDACSPTVDRLLQSDPLNPMIRWLPAGIDLGAGRFVRAAQFDWDRLPSTPNFVFVHALALVFAQCFHQVRELIQGYVPENADDVFAALFRLIGLAIDRDTVGTKECLTEELTDTCRRDPLWSYWVASCFGLAEQEDAAFDWLVNAIDRGFINFPLLAHYDPYFAKQRGQRRYETLMERVKHEWETFEI